MRRLRLPVLAAAAAGALVLTSCDWVPPAATVGDETITQADLQADVDVLTEHPEWSQAFLGTPVEQYATDATIDADVMSSLLRQRILYSIVGQELESRDVAVSDEVRELRESEVSSQIGDVWAQLPEDYRSWFIEGDASFEQLARELAGDDVSAAGLDDPEAFYEDNPELFTEVCSSHILVEDEETAADLLDELEDGADFGELAAAESIDPSAAQNSGDLGCTLLRESQFVAEFTDVLTDAPVGEVTDPVATQFGFHLILVTSRDVQDYDEETARGLAAAERSAVLNAALSAWITEVAPSVDVDVNPRYGTWDPTQLDVRAPSVASVGPR
ncbi:MAG: peptidylprolyl isomerase [Actinomycetota bacterium]|nr:peptidylprolyl isomerase [Actinomycetota bacterium]